MSITEQQLASFTLTHVHDPQDPLSYLCAWLALVPQALCIVYVTLIWASREMEVLMMFAGQLACQVLNFTLKRWIKEERPKQMHRKGYGMPSSHSQFVTFFASYLILFLLLRHVPNSPTSRRLVGFWEQIAVSFLTCISAAAVSISRIYLNYHTIKQVLAGCGAGMLFAIFWFRLITYLRSSGWIGWALDRPPARMARVRDLLISEDFAEAGWQRWNLRRKQK